VNQVRVTVRGDKLRRPPAPRPEPPAPPAAVLEELYVTQGLTLSQIGRRYRTTHYRVHDWLVAAGVPVAPRTTRAHRRTLPRELLEEMYLAEEMTAREIGAELECPPAHVLRALHDLGIPVRPAGRLAGDILPTGCLRYTCSTICTGTPTCWLSWPATTSRYSRSPGPPPSASRSR